MKQPASLEIRFALRHATSAAVQIPCFPAADDCLASRRSWRSQFTLRT